MFDRHERPFDLQNVNTAERLAGFQTEPDCFILFVGKCGSTALMITLASSIGELNEHTEQTGLQAGVVISGMRKLLESEYKFTELCVCALIGVVAQE